MILLADVIPSVISRLRDAMGARDVGQTPELEPSPAQPRELCIVIAYHATGLATHHGPFWSQDDATAWATAHLKFTAQLGWDVELLHSPEESSRPAQQKRAL